MHFDLKLICEISIPYSFAGASGSGPSWSSFSQGDGWFSLLEKRSVSFFHSSPSCTFRHLRSCAEIFEDLWRSLKIFEDLWRSLKLRCPCPPARSSECLSQTDIVVQSAVSHEWLQGNKNMFCDFDVSVVERQKTHIHILVVHTSFLPSSFRGEQMDWKRCHVNFAACLAVDTRNSLRATRASCCLQMCPRWAWR